MLPKAVGELRKLYSTPESLLELLAHLSGRDLTETRDELADHMALRAFFLLLGEVESAPNHRIIASRIAKRTNRDEVDVRRLATHIAAALANRNSAEVGFRSGVGDLSHTSRQELYVRQGHRCAVCGWYFDANHEGRGIAAASPTLDHTIPYRLGGDSLANLRILCGLCNSIKSERLHVGEHGPIWSNNFVFQNRQKVLAFWTLVRDSRCHIGDCNVTPASGRLYVTRANDKGAWSLDNCGSVCITHRGTAAAVEY